MKQLITCQPFVIKFVYIQSHSDDIKEWSACIIKERMNMKVDHLTKTALLHAHMTNKFYAGLFPLDDFVISMDGQKITGPIKTSLEAHWRRAEAKWFFDFKQIVHSPDFDLIWWEGMRNAMVSYPKMLRVFVTKTKQVSGWCGSNSKQSLWDTSISNVLCPNCGLSCDTLKHLTRCSNKGHVTLFRESVKDVKCCLERANVHVLLITIIKDYMIHQSLVTMESCTPPASKYTALTMVQDWLGWDCFVKGQILTLLIETV
jgi:hypothetical protein